MKKIFLLTVLAGLFMTSCEKEEVGGTATQSLAGEWLCTVYYQDVDPATGNPVWVDYRTADILTYNTSANVADEMWIDDQGLFWGTLCKIDCNADKKTFGTQDVVYDDQYYEVGQKIWNGKITEGAAVAPGSGSKVDKIEFYIQFEDDDPSYGTTYYMVGYRKTGFDSDNGVYVEDWDLPE